MFEACYENIPANAIERLNSSITKGVKIGAIAFTLSDGWVIVKNQNGAYGHNLPQALVDRIKTVNQLPNSVINTIAFAPNGGWVIINGNNGYETHDIPPALLDHIRTLNRLGSVINTIAFAPNGGWVIINGGNGFAQHDIPQALIDHLRTLKRLGSVIKVIAFAPNGGWVIIKDQNGASWNNIPQALIDRMRTLNRLGSVIKAIAFAPNGGWVIVNQLATGLGAPDATSANDDTFRLLTSRALSFYQDCYMFDDIKACYKINEIENFARELCASGNEHACEALKMITEMKTQGEYARLAFRVASHPIV